jgi:hypothetical protein
VKMSKLYSLIMLIGLIFLISLPVDAQWVTIARKIKTMRTGDTDIANVIIDSGTLNVYRAVIDTLTSNPRIKMVLRDDTKRQVRFTNELYTVSMQVDSLATGLSQITVAAVSSANPSQKTTNVAVNAIFGVCHKVGIKCILEE